MRNALIARMSDEGITAAYRGLFHREPSESERRAGLEFLKDAGENKWTQYAWVLLSSNEFAYVD